MRVIPFMHDKQEYEVRVISDGSTIYVKAFRDGRPANGYNYQVTFPVAFDMNRVLGVSAVDELVESAKGDVINGNWERFLEAVQATPQE